jgi:hypothetical protein
VYYVQITDINGCIAISNSFEYEDVPTAIDGDNTIPTLTIYPNPFNEETTVDFGKVVVAAELRIYDVLGKLLNEYELNNIDKFIIAREDKVNGVYFVEIEVKGQNKAILKLIIE